MRAFPVLIAILNTAIAAAAAYGFSFVHVNPKLHTAAWILAGIYAFVVIVSALLMSKEMKEY